MPKSRKPKAAPVPPTVMPRAPRGPPVMICEPGRHIGCLHERMAARRNK